LKQYHGFYRNITINVENSSEINSNMLILQLKKHFLSKIENSAFLKQNKHIKMISEGSCDTEVMKLKHQLCHHRKKKSIFKYDETENTYF